jgi:hypothetical protein
MPVEHPGVVDNGIRHNDSPRNGTTTSNSKRSTGEFEPDAAPVKEHLLVCEKCHMRLVGWDEYVRGEVPEAPVGTRLHKVIS